MADLSPITLKVLLDTGNLKQKTDEAANSVKKFGAAAEGEKKHVAGLGSEIKHLVSGFLGFEAIKKAGEFLGESAKTAVEAQKAYALFDRQIKVSTGSTNDQLEALHNSVEAMASANGVIADDLLPTMNIFARTTGSASKALWLQQVALDVSAGTGKNLTTVSMAMSRALTGNAQALNRLVPGAKNVKDQMAFLQKQFKGAAETAANKDPYQRMQVAFHDIQVAVGQGLLPILNDFTKYLTDSVPVIQDFFKQLNDPTTEVGAQWKTLVDSIMAFFKGIKDNWAIIQAFIAGLVAYKVATIAINTAMGIYQGVMAIATIATEGFGVALASTGIGAIAIAVGVLTAGIIGLNSAMGQSQGFETKKTPEFLLRWSQNLRSSKYQAIANKAEAAFEKTNPYDPNAADEAQWIYKKLQAGYDAVQKAKGAAVAENKIQAEVVKSISKQQQDAADAAAKAAVKAAKAAAKAASDARVAWLKSMGKLGVEIAPLLESQLGRIATAVKNSFTKIQEGIAKGVESGVLTQAMGDALSRYADKESAILTAIGKARDAVAEKYDLAKTLIGSVKDSVSQMLDLSSLGSSAQAVASSLNGILQKIIDFGKNVTSLKSAGLAKGLISQIANAGVDAGGSFAAGLVSATPDQIKAVNEAYKAVQDASSSVSDQVASAVYGDGVNLVNGLLAGIAAQDVPLMKAAESMGAKFARTFAKAVKLASDPNVSAVLFKKQMQQFETQTLGSANVPGVVKPLVQGSGGISVTNYNQTNASPNMIAQATVASIKFGLPFTQTVGHL